MSIPEILSPIKFSDLQNCHNRNFILCDETGKGNAPSEVFKDKKNIALIIGPEGGFSSNELNIADKFCQKLSLGERILKVDTAVVTALAYAGLQF